MKNAVAFLPLFLPFTLASFVLDTIKTSALTCEPLLLQWQGGKTPWTLSIIATDGSVLEDLETSAVTSFHWAVNFEAGTVVAARVTDSTGATATSNTFTIQSGSTDCTLKNVLPAQTGVLQPAKTDSNSPLSSPTIEQTFTTSPTSPGASPVSTVGTSSASQGLNPTISPAPPATAIQQFPSPSSSVAAFSSISTSRKPSAGGILGIVIAVVIFLVIVGLGLARWLRRRAGASSEGAFFDLEAQSSPPRWMDRPIYEAPSSNRFTSTNETQEPQALRTRPDVDVLPPPGAPSVAPRTEFTPGTNGVALTPKSRDTSLPSPYSEADATTNYVGSLESRIQALTEANAILADLARPSDSPPPAYN